MTEKGKQDAMRLGKRLEAVDLTAIYASTSGRAFETAQLIRGKRLVPIYADEQLREMHLGDWEGKTHEEIKEMDPIAFEHFWNYPHLYTPRRGERFIDVQNRAFAAIKRIVERHSEGNILIVTHGVVLKAVIARFKNAPLKELWAPPYMYGTSITIVKADGGRFELLLEGDVSHLEEVREV